MRNRHTMTRAAAVVTSALLVSGLAACSGGSPSDGASEADDAQGGGGDICAASDVLSDMSDTMAQADPTDLQATLDQLEELTSTVEGVDAPSEVADDWGTLSTALRDMTDSLQAAVDDPTDTEAMTEVTDAMSALSDQSVQEAGQAVSTYTTENC